MLLIKTVVLFSEVAILSLLATIGSEVTSNLAELDSKEEPQTIVGLSILTLYKLSFKEEVTFVKNNVSFATPL